MAHVKIQYDVMDAFCMDVFQRFGFTKEESRIISDVLLLSDVYGIESHGAQRLVRYHKGIASGMIKVHAKPEIVFETPVSAVVDGHDGMGQLIGHFAMDLAIKKAKEIGMAIVTVRDSNHFGIAGYYAKMACDQGLIGMAFTNSEAIVVPTFGKKAMLGTNPIAISMPAEPYPFFFDASTSVVTRGKFEMYRKAEKPIPDCWGLDANGHPCTNAAEESRRRYYASGRRRRTDRQPQRLWLCHALRNLLLHPFYGSDIQPQYPERQGRHMPWFYCH